MEEILQNFISLKNEKRDVQDEISFQRKPMAEIIMTKRKELESICKSHNYMADLGGEQYLLSSCPSIKISSNDLTFENISTNIKQLKQRQEELDTKDVQKFGNSVFNLLIETIKNSKPATSSFSIKPVKAKPDIPLQNATIEMKSILQDYLKAQQRMKDLVETYKIKKDELEKTLKNLEDQIGQNLESKVDVPFKQVTKTEYTVEPKNVKKMLNQKQLKGLFLATMNECFESMEDPSDFFDHLDHFLVQLQTNIAENENSTKKLQLRKKL